MVSWVPPTLSTETGFSPHINTLMVNHCDQEKMIPGPQNQVENFLNVVYDFSCKVDRLGNIFESSLFFFCLYSGGQATDYMGISGFFVIYRLACSLANLWCTQRQNIFLNLMCSVDSAKILIQIISFLFFKWYSMSHFIVLYIFININSEIFLIILSNKGQHSQIFQLLVTSKVYIKVCI